ncbi:MAG: hypothetical protein E6G08_12495 [Actinobacteria bacterium]|nr:MAG: hypothetical protein E6G08_12495 [Actinomycetota bacterium]
MGGLQMRRVAAGGAVGFIILNIIASAIVGSQPNYGASPTKITDYFGDHHKALLVSVVLLCIGLVLLIGVIAQGADMLRTAGLPDAATAFAVGGGVVVAIFAIGLAISGSMTQMAKSGTDPGTIRAFYQAAQFMLSVPLAWAGVFLVIPLARAALIGAAPRWVAPLNGLLVVFLVLGGISVRGSGALAVATGVLPVLAHIAFFLFLVEIALLLWRSAAVGARLAQPAVTAV